ncbi:Na+/H+ antiporter NhaC family protein [Sporosarcina sp. FSL K6-1508]|uniref:Na+/H+ antiporter NhaC family protein n=1 Tax=Sporosarcina sp. FSL K6-1508 TaxID=2921553 RepID=UPI0030F671D5
MNVSETDKATTGVIKVVKAKKKLQLPHVTVMMLGMMLFACLLTYIVPAGSFEHTDSGKIIAGTYHLSEQTPVNPLYALTLILDGGVKASSIIVLLLFMGGFFGAIFQLDSINNILNYLIRRFEKAGPTMLVLGLFSLMGLIGFFIGGDMMIVFVSLGVLLTRKLRLDPITALGVTFLPLFLAFSVSPAGMAMLGQMFSDGVPMYSGYGTRTIMFFIFMIITAIYVMLYAKRVLKNPLKSVMSNDKWLTDLNESKKEDIANNKVQKVVWQDVAVLSIVIVAPIVLAVGNTVFGWAKTYGNNTFITTFFIAFVLCFILKRKTVDEMINSFTKGVQDMVIVAVVIVLATTISVILQEGNILNTVVNVMTNLMAETSLGFAAVFIFFVSSIFNFLVPSGSGLMGVMLPIMQPVGDVLGMTPQVLITALSFGGGLGNLIVPTLGATVGAIALARANFGSWMKFMFPLFLIWFVVGSAILYVVSSIGWVGY